MCGWVFVNYANFGVAGPFMLRELIKLAPLGTSFRSSFETQQKCSNLLGEGGQSHKQ